MKGTLFLCGTPIGNLEDITLRELTLLKTADCIAAEDTRHTLRLLNHFQLTTPLVSYHEHNKRTAGQKLMEKLLEGKDIVLVTDAGMPGISDPGEELVRLCYENQIPVTAAPGPTAVITALVLSGLSTRRFVFEGFLPPGKKERRQVLTELARETRTIVLYEAPHRLTATLLELYRTLGDRETAVIRELTKRFEEVRRHKLSEQLAYFDAYEPKGEFVIVLEGIAREEIQRQEQKAAASVPIEKSFAEYTGEGLEEKEAMKRIAKERGITKREVYAYLMKKKEQ